MNKKAHFGGNTNGYNTAQMIFGESSKSKSSRQEEYDENSNNSCMSQRDVEGFNSDLNIFTSKYKVYDNIDFSSPSFYKQKSAMNCISENKSESDQMQMSASGYKFYQFSLQKTPQQQQPEFLTKGNVENINNINNLNYYHNNNSQLSSASQRGAPIFGPFTSSKKKEGTNDNNNNSNMFASIELTRRNQFINEFNNNQILEQETQMQKQKDTGKRRDMSVEQEYGQIVTKNNQKSVTMNMQMQPENQSNYQDENNYNENHNSKQKFKINWNVGDSCFKNINHNHDQAYETPNVGEQKRKGRLRGRIVDSSSAKSQWEKQNSNENSNNSVLYKNINKQVDQNNIIQHPSSHGRLTRRSANNLHESFQKQIFNKEDKKSATKKGNRNSSSDKMKSEAEEIEDNRIKHQESKKLKKLVKNKRRSEMHTNQQSSQKQNQMSQNLKNCAICLSIPEDSVYGVIKCSHEFCIDCIVQWSQVTNLCPMCRAEFDQIVRKNYNDSDDKQILIPVQKKKQRIHDDDEFYWEEVDSFLDDNGLDDVCYICETDQDEERLMVCDHCGFRICHTYCDDELLDDQVPLEDWFCHECRLRSELFN